MSSSYQDRFPDILEDLLGERLYQRAGDRGISDERMMSWYHTLGRDQKLFQIRVKDALAATEKVHEEIERMKENLREQIEKYEKVQTGTVEDMVYRKHED